METLIVLIIIFVAVLSTPLSLKKLIDHANRHKQLELNTKPDEQAKARAEEPSDDWDDPWDD